MKRLALLTLFACTSSSTPVAPDAEPVETRSLLEIAMSARDRLDPRFRAQFRADLGAAMARASNPGQAVVELAAALEEANALADPNDRDRVVARVARGYIAVGDRAKAKEIAERIGTEERGEILGELAGDLASALAISTPLERDRALARLATIEATAGNLDRAGQIATRISDESLRPPVMGTIVAGMLKAGRTIDANRLMGQLDGLAKSEGGAAFALWAAAKGDAKAAKKWTAGIEAEFVRARTLALQAAAAPMGSAERKRLTEQAMRIAFDLASEDLRNGAIEAVARAFADSVDPVSAALVLEQGVAEPVRNQPGQVALSRSGARRVRLLVASTWAATGAVDQATRLAELIDDTLLAAEAWGAVARASAQRGNIEAALAASARIIHDELRIPVVAHIAALPPQGEPTASMRQAMTTAILRDDQGSKR